MVFTRFLLIVAFFLLSCQAVNGQFSAKEQIDIRKKATGAIKNYETRLNAVGRDIKSVDQTRNNIEQFLKLFTTRKTQIFNDLDPEYKLSEMYEAETYISNLALWYPAGIKIVLDMSDAQVSNIISYNDNVYSIDFIIEKKINGLFKGSIKNNNTERLLFRVGFTATNGLLDNFKIVGIRKADDKNYKVDRDKVMEVKGIQFSPDIAANIDLETKTILKDYSNYLSLIGDTIENIEEKIMYKKSFRTLFASSNSLVYNDILPGNQKNQFVSPSDYINLYSEAYASEGGVVYFDLDSANLGYIVKKNDSVYNRQVEVKKSFKGNYLGKRIVEYNTRISFAISFKYSNRVYKLFRIEKIEPVTEIVKNQNETLTFSNLNKQKQVVIKPSEAKGTSDAQKINKFIFNVGAIAGVSKIKNDNLNSAAPGSKGLNWQTKPMLYFNAYGQFIFMVYPSLGLLTGAGFSYLNTQYLLQNNDSGYFNNTAYLDVNNQPFYKFINANYDSTVSISYIDIPIGFVYSYKIKRMQFIIKPFVNVSILQKATSFSNGFKKYYGFFPNETDSVYRIKDWAEYGFFNDFSVNRHSDIRKFFYDTNFSFNIAACFNIILSSHITLSFTGSFKYSISELLKEQNKNVSMIALPEIKYEKTYFYTLGLGAELSIRF